MNFFLYFILLTFISSFPTKSDSLETDREAKLKTPSNSPNAQKLTNHNFDERSGSPLSKEDRDLAFKLLGEPHSNSPAIQTLSDAHLQNKPTSPPSKEDWERLVELLKSESGAPTVPQNILPGQTLERPLQLRQLKNQMAEELLKLNSEFFSLSSTTPMNPGLSAAASQNMLQGQTPERFLRLRQSQIQMAEELGNLYADYFHLLSSAAPTNPTEANPLRRIHQDIVPGNPHLELSPLNFRNSPINSGISHEQAMKSDLYNHQGQGPLGRNSMSHTIQSSYHPTDGQGRKISGESSISISKAISSDSSASEEAAAKIFSKLPRLLK
jgi:hypothetical protein